MQGIGFLMHVKVPINVCLELCLIDEAIRCISPVYGLLLHQGAIVCAIKYCSITSIVVPLIVSGVTSVLLYDVRMLSMGNELNF